jgi:putative hemolysin
LLVAAVLLAGCGSKAAEPTPGAGLPNPAAVNCEEKGGKVEIRTDASGGQYGVCIFDDGSECDEWAFFRGECQPGQMKVAPEPGTQ